MGRTGWSWVVFGAGIAAVLASFMPWGTVFFVSVSGFDGGDGKLTAAAGVAAAIFGVLCARGSAHPKTHIGSALCGAGIAFVGVVDFVDMNDSEVTVGSGLYLTIAAGIAIVVGALAAMAAPEPALTAPPPPSMTPSAGWYADPYGQATSRWWDGQRWTEHTH